MVHHITACGGNWGDWIEGGGGGEFCGIVESPVMSSTINTVEIQQKLNVKSELSIQRLEYTS